jgi:hypothetical protein
LFSADAENRTAATSPITKRIIRDEEARKKGRQFVEERKQAGTQTIDSLRFLTLDIALVDVTIQWRGEVPMTTMNTYILRKEAGWWKIVAGRVAVPAKRPAMPQSKHNSFLLRLDSMLADAAHAARRTLPRHSQRDEGVGRAPQRRNGGGRRNQSQG